MRINPSGIRQGIPTATVSGVTYFIINGPCIIQPERSGPSGIHIPINEVPPLTIRQSGVPESGLFENTLINLRGIQYIYDDFREAWLSSSRFIFGYGSSGIVSNEMLVQNGISSLFGGLNMLRPAMITAMSIASDNPSPWQVIIFRNRDIRNPLFISPIIGVNDRIFDNLSIELSRGDTISCYASGTFIRNPQAWLELAWRATRLENFQS